MARWPESASPAPLTPGHTVSNLRNPELMGTTRARTLGPRSLRWWTAARFARAAYR